MRILFTAWRDLAHPLSGGSELLVSRLAEGVQQRGHTAALLCGGPVGPRPYKVVRAGGDYTQYLRAPIAYLRHFRDYDVVVDVENGIPFFAPLWRRRPVVCMVHHVHKDQWPLRFPAPVARAGWFLEGRVMPRVYRNRLFVECSESTRQALCEIGVDPADIRSVPIGTDAPPVATNGKSAEPVFMALGRLVPHKRVDLLLRLWARVQPVVGGTLLIVGDGPERARLEAQAGPGVRFLGAVSEEEKWRLLSEAWLLVHPALHEGWGIVIMEAAAAGTPALAFDVSGVRDAVDEDGTGVLARSDDELVERWIALTTDPARRAALGAAGRVRAGEYTWERSIDALLDVAAEAVARSARATAA